jgi:hypothetical protein
MAHSGLLPISNILGSKDIPSLQLWLKRVGASMPDISTVERKIMENQKKQFVPLEMKGRMTKNTYKKQGSTEPDWKGTFMYQGQVITFGALDLTTTSKSTTLTGTNKSSSIQRKSTATLKIVTCRFDG